MARPKASKKETQNKSKIPGFDPVAASDSGPSQGLKPGSSSPNASQNESIGPVNQPSVKTPIEKPTKTQVSIQTPSHNVGSAGDRGGTESRSIPLRLAHDSNPKVPEIEKAPEQLSPLGVTQFPPRPGHCTVGRPVQVLANYFEVNLPSDLEFHRYSVTIEPDVKGKKRKQLFKILLKDIPELASVTAKLVTNYQNLIISCRELPYIQDRYIKYRAEGETQASDRAQEYSVQIKRVYDQQRLNMTKLLQYITSQQHDPSFLNKMHVLTETLNILLSHTARSSTSISTIGDKRVFDVSPHNPKLDLGAALVALRGYFSSVKIADGRVLSNVSVSYGAFYDPIRLDKLMDVYCIACGLEWVPASLKSLEAFVKGLRVEVSHLRRQENGHTIRKCKTVFGLANQDFDGRSPRGANEGESSRKQDHPPRFTRSNGPQNASWSASSGPIGAGPEDVKFFEESTAGKPVTGGPDATPQGRYTSVWEYFKKKNIRVRTDTCLVNVGNAKFPVYLPPDLCDVNPGQLFRSRLSPGQTDRMIGFAVHEPKDTKRYICEGGLRTMGFLPPSNDPRSQQTPKIPCGIRVSSDMFTVNGHVLESPDLKYRGDVTIATKAKGSWNMRPLQPKRPDLVPKFREADKLRQWAWLVISKNGNVTDVHRERLRSFMQAMNNAGIDTTAPQGDSVPDTNTAKSLNSCFKAWSGKGLQLLLIMLPKKDTLLYNQIKQLGDKRYGIQTVCIGGPDKFLSPKFSPLSYFANVALKVNLKLMGTNHVLESRDIRGQGPGSGALGIISEGKTMVLGIDVTHPSPGSAENAPSVAAMVASTDKVLAQWPAALRIQKIDTRTAETKKQKIGTNKATDAENRMKGARQEMVSGVKEMFIDLLNIWKSRNNRLYPENILIYRDGVSESQYAQVLRDELQPLRDQCAHTYPPEMTARHLPRFTLIVVGKRHHTRFFPILEPKNPRKAVKNSTADDYGNPEPGLVVDRAITSSHTFDFFLQSHAAIKGTARPAHYVVLADEIFSCIYKPHGPRSLPGQCKSIADVIQTLTHNMCYLYGRATRAVSYCPAAFYADRACERARRYLGGHFDAAVDEGSMMGGVGRPDVVDAVDADVTVHERLRGTMFYI